MIILIIIYGAIVLISIFTIYILHKINSIMSINTSIISITNLKGGVAKTTTTANLGAGLAKLGYKVLMVDWDPQGNLTMHFGYNPEEVSTLYEALDTDQEDFYQANKLATLSIENYANELFLFGNNFSLSKFESMFSDPSLGGGHMVLSNVLNLYKGKVDFILIDCQPSLSLLTVNAYYASDFLFIPLEVGSFSKNGMDKILFALKRLNKNYNRDIKVGGVFFTRMESNTVISRDYVDYFASAGDIPLMQSQIRRNIAIKECQEMGMDIFSYDRKNSNEAKRRIISNSNEDYYNFIQELLVLTGRAKSMKASRGLNADSGVHKKQKGKLAQDFITFLNA